MANKRDGFKSTWGFILASVGSSVGCGNLWRFPIMVSKYGGLTYIIPYILFVIIVANSGLMEEFALGRAAQSGPIKAFGFCAEKRGWHREIGETIGILPVLGSLGLAIGYTCVFGWIVKYAAMAITGDMFALGTNLDNLDYAFSVETASAGSNNAWIIVAIVIALGITVFGVSAGIERSNKFMMPVLFLMLIVLAIYISTIPGASEGYKYIFTISLEGLIDPDTWIYAFGMAFFSLSVAGNGLVIYGSYMPCDEDIPSSAMRVAVFDTIASVLATFVIIPAMAAGGVNCDSAGPGLIFIYLVNVFNGMPFGRAIGIIFFVLFIFAALSSIINLYEVSVAFVCEFFKSKRVFSSIFVLGFGCIVAMFIQGIVSQWMDVVNNFICPIGALLAAIMFFWVAGEEFALKEVNAGAKNKRGKFFIYLGKYFFCACAIVALVCGLVFGEIG